jgi:hypothetical protein
VDQQSELREQVLDVPCVKVVIGKTMRRRHDTCSIAALIRQLNAPEGFRVVPIRAQAWKMAAGIYGQEYTKDDSRELASLLFPELSPLLKRKKDHGKIDNSFCDFGNHISDISVPSK